MKYFWLLHNKQHPQYWHLFQKQTKNHKHQTFFSLLSSRMALSMGHTQHKEVMQYFPQMASKNTLLPRARKHCTNPMCLKSSAHAAQFTSPAKYHFIARKHIITHTAVHTTKKKNLHAKQSHSAPFRGNLCLLKKARGSFVMQAGWAFFLIVVCILEEDLEVGLCITFALRAFLIFKIRVFCFFLTISTSHVTT